MRNNSEGGFSHVNEFCELPKHPVIKSPELCSIWHQGNLIKIKIFSFGINSEHIDIAYYISLTDSSNAGLMTYDQPKSG